MCSNYEDQRRIMNTALVEFGHLSLNVLLLGDESLSYDQNVKIFDVVQSFILVLIAFNIIMFTDSILRRGLCCKGHTRAILIIFCYSLSFSLFLYLSFSIFISTAMIFVFTFYNNNIIFCLVICMKH